MTRKNRVAPPPSEKATLGMQSSPREHAAALAAAAITWAGLTAEDAQVAALRL